MCLSATVMGLLEARAVACSPWCPLSGLCSAHMKSSMNVCFLEVNWLLLMTWSLSSSSQWVMPLSPSCLLSGSISDSHQWKGNQCSSEMIFKNKREGGWFRGYSLGYFSLSTGLWQQDCCCFPSCLSFSEITITTMSTVIAAAPMSFIENLLCAWHSARLSPYVISHPHTTTSRLVLLSPLYRWGN